MCAFSSIASNTGARSPGEELMTCNTSAVAVCCSKASRVSVISRAFSIAMTACAAKFCSSAICFLGKRPHLTAGRRRCTPSRRSSLRSGTNKHGADARSSYREHFVSTGSSDRGRIDDVDDTRAPISMPDGCFGPGSNAAAADDSAKASGIAAHRHRSEVLAVINVAGSRTRPRRARAPSPASHRTPARGRRARN